MSTTRRDLTRRLQLLLALTVVGTAVLFASYQGVHSDAGALRTTSKTAVLAVDTAEYALNQAQRGAGSGAADSDDFQTQVSVAGQSLSQAAASNVRGLEGRQTLQTVAGLIVVYTGWVQKADQEPQGSILRTAYLGYARSVLTNSAGTGIIDRLDQLQSRQLDEVRRQSSFGWPLWLGWGATLVLFAALSVGVLEAQLFLRRRFRRRYNRPLVAATVLLAAPLVLGLFTWQTHAALGRAHTALLAKAHSALPPRPSLTASDISDAEERVGRDMRGTAFRTATAYGIPFGGAMVAVLVFWGLQPRISDYGFRSR
ncbi:hypothetical protein [Streptantibioticus ferralitis]|uniref:Integral membrane protein n=1 Tax=Streptantibioticus ferralitis TaxID=236510 RepID=A0ABT5YWT9_9ACTN|nr:hypothetical protein [Streptantibioticus ferralitis]MDF2256073.1 hypothetical protein [Streptantibioticus ferralitis]